MYNPYAQDSGKPAYTSSGQTYANQAPAAASGTAASAPAYQTGAAGHPGQAGGASMFNNFLGDPAAQMGMQFSQSAFNASQQYMQQNLKQFVSEENIKYYFKVSNGYVLQKLTLILFPYKNKTWTRQYRASTDQQGNSVQVYATPVDDTNAPDLYIPSMALVTYILLWAVFSGVTGDFHPQMFGYAMTRTLAFYILDLLILKVSFYALGISKPKIWDLAAYSGYKFVTVTLVMIAKNVLGSYTFLLASFVALVFALGFFLMRSLRYEVLPSGMDSGSISSGSKRLRSQFLFIYSFLLQAIMVWLMA